MSKNNYGLLCPEGMEQVVSNYVSARAKVLDVAPCIVIVAADSHEQLVCGGINGILRLYDDPLSIPLTTFHVSTCKAASQPSQKLLREELIRKLAQKARWAPKQPDTHIIAVVTTKTYYGVDLTGDLGKREYKAYFRQPALRGPLAWGLWQLLGLDNGMTVWCPLVVDGTLPIEARLLQDVTVHAWAPKQRLRAARANAKLAQTPLTFAEHNISYAKTFDPQSIDRIGIQLPPVSTKKDSQKTLFFYRQLINQTSRVLRGKLGILTYTNDFKKLATALRLEQEQTWWTGKQPMHIQVFSAYR